MIDITSIEIRGMFVHRVGNLLRSEGVTYSDFSQKVPSRDKLPLIQFLFGQADRLNSYSFTHSVNPELNTVSVLATGMSREDGILKKVSCDIAAHLYSVSNHPRVKSGNLFVGVFDGVGLEGKSHRVLGIFKSDTVDDFIKVDVKGGKASLKVEQGAAVTSLDKVGLVFLPRKGKPERILAACARGEDAIFWNDRFLQIVPTHSAKADTKACLDICRAFATQEDGRLDDPERILFLNRSLEFFEKADKYDEQGFASVFTSKAQEKEFKQFKAQREVQDKRDIPENFEIEKIIVRKERTKFEKNVRLDANIEIRLRFKSQNEMKNRVEQGFDEEKGLAFYKLYYSNSK
jgi:hypothetical protein